MKLLYIATGYTPVLPSSTRSVETSIHMLTREQAKLGHDVVVADIRTSESRESPVLFHELWTPNTRASNIVSYLLKIIAFTLQLPAVIYKHRDVDIIQAYSQFPVAIAAITKKLLGLRAPVIYLTCSPYLAMPTSLSNRLRHTLIESWALKMADRLLVHTSTISRALNQRFKVDTEKMTQIPAGVDVDDIISRPPQLRDQGLIFYPAVITPRKNQLAIVETLPGVLKAHPGCKVVFAGPIEDQRYYGEIQEFITEQGLSNVLFTGALTKSMVYELYQKAGLMVFPTLSEMQGIILLEAMAFGVPVIASDIEVIREIADLEEGSALLVDISDNREVEKAVIKVLGDKDLQRAMSEKGKKLVRSRFSWTKIAECMEEEYEHHTHISY